MIYTVTFNPSLDYIVDVKYFKKGTVNRTSAEKIFPGGKGINVSIVLNNLGLKNTALGFEAGFTGKEIIRLLSEVGIETDFINVSGGLSRINIKMRSDSETEINGIGPIITKDDIDKLYRNSKDSLFNPFFLNSQNLLLIEEGLGVSKPIIFVEKIVLFS